MTNDWDFPHYACEHGIRSGHEFMHLLGPTTSSSMGVLVEPCYPTLVTKEASND